MKKAWVAMVIVGAVVAMLLLYYLLGGFVQDPSGFQEDDLQAPFVSDVVRNDEYPGPLSGSNYPMHVQPSVSYGLLVYADFGGVLELFMENEGSNEVYVHHYYVFWEGGNETFQVNCSRLISSGEVKGLGELYFAGPGEPGPATLEVWAEVWTSSPNGMLWDDQGEMLISTIDLNVVEEGSLREWKVERNPVQYYNKVNGLIDLEVVSSMASDVRSAVPGNYSLLQVIEAYELISQSIDYAEDEDNHWQSPAETIALGSGDCEDHSLLMASLITVLGGNCRVNLIAGHAFPSVYVGNDSVIGEVIETIQAYYGNPVPVHYTVDDLGYWMIVDTNGLPYVGGYPAASSPAGGAGGVNWSSDDGDWIKLIDVTGETVDTLF
ncbi:MAG TPA: hypothetical protein PLC39_04405 [Methanomassiliicoccales archaeon]|nr:hypothetical protein [Methanomassiliicoccales archaeon]HPR98522.1 hypothetical protein [Methanomassiliicoccales archaeon]